MEQENNSISDQILVIFGASGDLTRRKLIPSIFELFIQKLLPNRFLIIGVARTFFTDEDFRHYLRESLQQLRPEKHTDDEILDRFLQLVYYVSLDPADFSQYSLLAERLSILRSSTGIPNRIVWYLATPPLLYSVIPENLDKSQLNRVTDKEGWRRIVVEKPFGTNLLSAQRLNEQLRTIFAEKEIYRIDHYLGKETVQNILVLRFANGIFEPLWDRNYIDYVEISATETLGVERRGKYYEGAGALRDMVQNHLMQLMAFVAMEAPAAFDPESLRDEVAKVLRSLHPADMQNIIRGQYITGTVDGKEIPAYRNEKDVRVDSMTETFVAMKFYIDNWRWGGIPFYFFTGKCLPEKESEIIIHFKATPQRFFAGECSGTSCNKLTLRIQPDESISLKFGLKMPGAGFTVKQVSMDFRYSSLADNYLADAYERLLLDVMQGDSTLYTRSDALEASWRFIDPILQQWGTTSLHRLFYYPAGSDGPPEARILMNGSGKSGEDGICLF